MKLKSLKSFLMFYISRLNSGTYSSVPGSPLINNEGTDRVIKERYWINLLLFIITFCSTTYAGAGSSESIKGMLISGHYFAAKKFNVKSTLPYFIPFPSLIGTMGAVIKTRSPIQGRRSLLYIGSMGPLPGFAMSLAAVIAGVYLSEIKPMALMINGPTPVFGDSILFTLIVKAIHGTLPKGYDICLHPVAWAGWIGFLITSLNLMPVGQLDGGHILYALIGRRQRLF
jgi:membrane-associated protease RseP (regulator of RpoE activity)